MRSKNTVTDDDLDRLAARELATDVPAVDALLDRSRAGDEAAVGALFEHCRAYLLEIANAELPADLGARVAPSDLVQDTFAEALQAFPRFRGRSEGELRRWLRQILLHNLEDARRYFICAKKRNPGQGMSLAPHGVAGPETRHLPDPAASPSSLVLKQEAAEKLRAAIDRLPNDYRLVVRLRHFEGLSLARVGEHMGRSPEAVRKLWFRGIEKLADFMDDDSVGR